MLRFWGRVFLLILCFNSLLYTIEPIKNQIYDHQLLVQYNKEYKQYRKEKKYRKAISHLLKIIQIEKQYNENNYTIAIQYNDIGGLYKSLGEYKKTLIFYQKDLNLTESILGKNTLSTAISYYSMGEVYRLLDKNKKSLFFFKEALAINKNIFTINHPFSAIIHDDIAKTYTHMINYSKALIHYKKALEIKIKNKNHLSIIKSYNSIGLLYNSMGKYKNALLNITKALEINRKSSTKRPLYIATIYNNLGLIYNSISDYDKSLQFYQKALNIRKKILNINHPSFTKLFNNIAKTYMNINNYPTALAYYKKALVCNKKKIDNHETAVNIYNNMGCLYKNMGEYNKALAYYKKALALNPHHYSSFIIYNNIAMLYTNTNEYKKALKHYEYVLKKLPKNHPLFGDLYNNLGLLHSYMKNHKKALQYYNHALRLKEKVLGKNHPTIATILNNIGLVYKSKGEYKNALNYMRKSLAIKEKIFTKTHSSLSISYDSLSSVHHLLKNYTQAYYYENKAFDIFMTNRNINFSILNSKEKDKYLKDNTLLLEHLLSISNEYISHSKSNIQSIKNDTLNSWLNYKGTLFEYQNILSMVKNNPKTSQSIIESINELNNLNRKISNTKEFKKEKVLKEKIHRIEIELSKQNDTLKSILNLNKINSSQIANHLQAHQLYIDFARGDDNYYIFTIDKENNIDFQQIDKNHTKLIDQNIKEYRANTDDMAEEIKKKRGINRDFIEQSKNNSKKILSNLYTILIDKYLRNIIKEKTELIISPDGLLNYFPFEALYNGDKYFISSYTINYISSGKEFLRQTKITKKRPKIQMTLFANADFNTKIKSPMFANTNKQKKIEKYFKNLGDRELKVIKKHYSHPIIFQEKNASIHNLKTMKSSKIVHISTHGAILKEKNIINPMRKSILIFAGGNNNIDKASISALELSTLDLKDTELIVLSACQSGLGEIQNAEGVIGLPKALLQAGAKNVIMSLWRVSNEKTAMLMEYFYDNISQGKAYNIALRDAKIKMIELHPYYWSSFILSGL